MFRDVIAWLRSFLCLKQSGYACSAECQQQQWSYSEHQHDANWRPKNDHTHSLIPLCTYRYVFMAHGMQGSEEPRDQRNLSRPSPAVRRP